MLVGCSENNATPQTDRCVNQSNGYGDATTYPANCVNPNTEAATAAVYDPPSPQYYVAQAEAC